MIKEILKKNKKKLERLEKCRFLFVAFIRCIPFYGNLNILAIVFGSDKNGGHNYTQYYARHFRKYRMKKIKLLEIGIGGYENPHKGGESLRMWKKYFPFGRIAGLDLYDKKTLQERRIAIYQGSQVEPAVLDRIVQENGEFDIIIDDGSHINEHIITTFEYLFPKLKKGGIYVIEDVQTSYWESYGGDSADLNNPKTAMNYFKKLTDCLNYSEFTLEGYRPSIYDLNITEIHFYHNLIFIYKNDNSEGSNVIGKK